VAFSAKRLCSRLAGILLIFHLNGMSGKVREENICECEKTVAVQRYAAQKDYLTFKIDATVCLQRHLKH
jgi:hypothetical protein